MAKYVRIERKWLEAFIKEPWRVVGTDRYHQEGAVVLAKILLKHEGVVREAND